MSNTIYIYEPIGQGDKWSGGMSAKEFSRQLDLIPPRTQFTVRLNSEGGNAFDGIAIHNAIKARKSYATACIDGVAASAASVIAMGAGHIEIGADCWLMIHNCNIVTGGTADELRKTAEMMDDINETLATIYAKRMLQTLEHVQKLMRAETWFNATDAVAAKLADSINRGQRVAACANLAAFDYKNVPAHVREAMENSDWNKAMKAFNRWDAEEEKAIRYGDYDREKVCAFWKRSYAAELRDMNPGMFE